jgi:F-type H+-transporting ATPase subunit c
MRKFSSTLLWTVLVRDRAARRTGREGAAGGGSSWGYALGAGLAVGLAGLGCGIGQGLTAGNTTAGHRAQSGAAGAMFTNFSSGWFLIESIAIYGLVDRGSCCRQDRVTHGG